MAEILKKAIEESQPLKEAASSIGSTTQPKKIISKNVQVSTKKRPNYNSFKANNWLKVTDNEVLQRIHDKGGAVWLTPEGEVACCLDGKEVHELSANKASIVLSNFINKQITIFKTKETDIDARDLHLVHSNEFDPHINQEFYKDGAMWRRNTFKPTRYMKLIDKPKREPKTILRFLLHLVSDNEEYFCYLINWLAAFWQTLQKPVTAIALRGTQGTGKGIFFIHIIQPLFGEEQTIQINDHILNSKYLGPLCENRLFYNLDEISANSINDKQGRKNFLKGLTTNLYNTLDTKYNNVTHAIKTPGAVLITSNEPYFLDIEPEDRRYNVFTSDIKLSTRTFLVGTFDKLIEKIYLELEDFARYLYHYEADFERAAVPLDTPEKQALIEATNDQYTLFANAIKHKNLEYFEKVKEQDLQLHIRLKDGFKKGYIRRSDITPLFIKVTDKEIKPKKLLKELKIREPLIFAKEPKTIKGERYIIID